MCPDDCRAGSPAAETTHLDASCTETARASDSWDGPDSLLLRVIEQVADVTAQSHDEMEPLHSVLDPDALERLLTNSDSAVRLTFAYEDCIVTAATDGTVIVQPDR